MKRSASAPLWACAVAWVIVFAAPGGAASPDVRPELLFHAPFDGSAVAERAKGAREPVRAEKLAFAEGLRGQAVRLTAESALAYAAPGNRVREHGTLSLWFRRERPNADWRHLAVSWNATGSRTYLDGIPVADAGNPAAGMVKAQDVLALDPRTFDGFVDDLRIYSSPLSDGQIREIWRRETVVDIKAVGRYALAETKGVLSVSATSPGGCDLSGLRYCLCDGEGRVVATYKDAVGPRSVELLVNLPEGEYRLRTTDGTWFYGGVPCFVMRQGNAGAAETPAVRINEPRPAEPPSGIARMWSDLRNFDRDHLQSRQARLAKETKRAGWNRIVVRSSEEPPVKRDLVVLVASIEQAIERMKSAGENLLACPCGWDHGLVCGEFGLDVDASDRLSAWYAKFDEAELFLMPTVDAGVDCRDAKKLKHLSDIFGALLVQGAEHPSFRGIRLRVVCSDASAPVAALTDFCLKEARRLAERRVDLRLWIDGVESVDAERLAREAPNVILGATSGRAPKDVAYPLVHAQGHFAEALRQGDALGLLDSGGDRRQAPFIQAFRALPAVRMDDVAAEGSVRVRCGTFDDRSYFYVVNTDARPVSVTIEFPARSEDLVTGEAIGGGFFGGPTTRRIQLKPHGLRSFSAPQGVPSVVAKGGGR